MRHRLLWFTRFFVLATGVLLLSFQMPHETNSTTPAAIWSQGILRLTIPATTPHQGAGVLAIEVLDPEDQVIGHSEQRVDTEAGKATWRAQLRIPGAPRIDDLVWHRLRYRFTYDGENKPAVEGIDSISQILHTPVLRILAQQSYLAGSVASVRAIVTDSANQPISGPGSLRIDLSVQGEKPRVLFSGPLDRRGSTESRLRFPAGLTGACALHYVADTPEGSVETTQPVHLDDQVSVLLTTEKPIYQPGQTIHVRALALNRATHEAAARRSLTFEVEDSRGNKVFRSATETSQFGIASAEFALADEVNLGTYHLRAILDKADGAPTAEIALNVDKYVLPKFKVAIDFAASGQKERHGYRPGDHVTGTVHANYFFGKPVDEAELTIKASGMDVQVFDVASVQGRTNRDGEYHFDLKLPDYFAGRPVDHGAARVLIEATVKDSAGHAETRGAPITVSESPLIIAAVPEGGTLIPGIENQVFILTSYADGKPASAALKVGAGAAQQNVTSDSDGLAVVNLKPSENAAQLHIDATDKEGNHASSDVALDLRAGGDQILLRTEHAVYRAGDRIRLRIFSTSKHGAAYVDVIREGQTILTRDIDINNGSAELLLTTTPEMAGALDINAYQFGRDARPIADHRLVFVQPADELKIEASADRAAYKPGDNASIHFHVTNSRGEGVQAALGLQVVDEAVFALAEKRPGFAKVFFYLEQEAMKPRYEIHSIGMSDVVEPVPQAQAAHRDLAARALFAATDVVNSKEFETEAGRTVSDEKFFDYFNRYRAGFLAGLRKLSPDDLAKGRDQKLLDAWDNRMRVLPLRWGGPETRYLVLSAGPDKQFDTQDDLAANVEVRTHQVLAHAELESLEVKVEHDRGPFNGLSEIVGRIVDQTGAMIPGAVIETRDVASGQTRRAVSRVSGQFNVGGVPPGTYEVRVSAAGFEVASRRLTLTARDRADLSVTLKVGRTTELVAVSDAAGPRRGFAAGVAGGVVMVEQMGLAQRFARADGVNLAAAMPAPLPVAAMAPSAGLTISGKIAAAPEPHVRSWFPEALYINPQIVTDPNGAATISVPIADSITTWRMAMIASTARGALGSGTGSLKVFQDFFADLDLPLTLTQGDRVDIPVAVYNYSGGKGTVSLKLQPEAWFSLADDAGEKSLDVEPDHVGGSHFNIEAKRIGKFKLTLTARLRGVTDRADIVVREIEVIPNGREQDQVFNGRLETAVHQDLNFPASAIPEASAVLVRLYPGPLSQVIEGMDAILRMPGGCFEQTSSSTYPNVLALDYMKHTGKLTPEVHAKAEGFIANGYQRLLTFEVAGGGFSWFGNAPANKILTAYGLMEFSEMAKVYDVDPKLIERTREWMASQQQADGSWKPDAAFINEGATNRYNSDLLRIAAYIAWSLESTGDRGPAVEKAKQFIENHLHEKADAYTLAVLANFAVDYGKDREFTSRTMHLLLDARTEKDEQAWWTSEETGVFGAGESASVETTGLAVQALLKWGEASPTVSKALRYIASKKDAEGTWGTTQATIMALRALLLSTGKAASDVRGTLQISLNGHPVRKLELAADNNDLLHQFVLKNVAQSNSVDITFAGKGGLAYQVVGRYFLPWGEKPANEALSIAVAYDRTRLEQDDVAKATATITNHLPQPANMVMVDLGIPPGFDLLTEDLQDYEEHSAGRKSGRLEKFTLTATQAILYFDSFAPGDTVTLHYRLRAKYPIRARTFLSRVYEYYDPAVSSIARPVQLEVAARH